MEFEPYGNPFGNLISCVIIIIAVELSQREKKNLKAWHNAFG